MIRCLYETASHGLQPCEAHAVKRDADHRVLVEVRYNGATLNVLGQFVRDLDGNLIAWGKAVPSPGDRTIL